MTTKEYLSQIYLLNVKVKTKRQQAAELRNSIAGISGIDYTGIKVQTTPTPKMQEAIDRLISLEERLRSGQSIPCGRYTVCMKMHSESFGKEIKFEIILKMSRNVMECHLAPVI